MSASARAAGEAPLFERVTLGVLGAVGVQPLLVALWALAAAGTHAAQFVSVLLFGAVGAMVIALPCALFAGVPLALVLRRIDRFGAWPLALGGACTGAAVALAVTGIPGPGEMNRLVSAGLPALHGLGGGLAFHAAWRTAKRRAA